MKKNPRTAFDNGPFRLLWPILAVALCAACAGREPAKTQVNCPLDEIGPGAVWNEGNRRPAALLKERCPGEQNQDPGACLRAVMEELEAPPQAVLVSTCLGRPGFLCDFYESGRVDAALARYPLNRDAPYGYVLVNGSPRVLDVNNPALWPEKALKSNARYGELEKTHSGLSIVPGIPGEMGQILVKDLPEGGQRFIPGYKLLGDSPEGGLAGHVEFSFDFDRDGAYLGSGIASLGEAIHTAAGGTVTIDLENTAQDGSWRMARVPAGVVSLLEKQSGVSEPGADHTVDVWKFRAEAPGDEHLVFLNYNPEDKGDFPEARRTFSIKVHESPEAMHSALMGEFEKPVESYLREIGSARAGKVSLEVVGVYGDHARVDVHPRAEGLSKSASVILSFSDGQWQALSIADEYDKAFYRKHKIPRYLQTDPRKPKLYFSVPVEKCAGIREAFAKALNVRAGLQMSTAFVDYLKKDVGHCCRVTARESGARFEGMGEVLSKVGKALRDLGWTEDPAYASTGPLGTMAGFRRHKELIIFRIIREPAEGVGLLEKTQPSLDSLLPEDLVYTITLDCAELP